jgi:hypothetical protein
LFRNSPERNSQHIREFSPERDPTRVGVRDLNPFAQGGGMIFDPFAERQPYGRVPSALGVPGRLPPYVHLIQ